MTEPFGSVMFCPKCKEQFKFNEPDKLYVTSGMLIGNELVYRAGACDGEKILRTCRSCGYRWFEACADAEADTQGAVPEMQAPVDNPD